MASSCFVPCVINTLWIDVKPYIKKQMNIKLQDLSEAEDNSTFLVDIYFCLPIGKKKKIYFSGWSVHMKSDASIAQLFFQCLSFYLKCSFWKTS